MAIIVKPLDFWERKHPRGRAKDKDGTGTKTERGIAKRR